MAKSIEKRSDYQGWENYETYLVKLWIDNDRGFVDMVKEWVQEIKDEKSTESEDEYSFSSAAVELGDRIKDYIEDNSPLVDTADFYADLLNSAISEVDFREIADSFIQELVNKE